VPRPGQARGDLVEQHVVDVPRDHAVEHADVDRLAASGRVARQQRRQDPDHRHQRAAADVGDLHAGDDRRLILLADEVQHAAVAEIVDVVSDPAGVRTVLAVAGDRAVDESRIARRERRVVDAEPRHHAGPEALEQHV
jgi:hypothetical protein